MEFSICTSLGNNRKVDLHLFKLMSFFSFFKEVLLFITCEKQRAHFCIFLYISFYRLQSSQPQSLYYIHHMAYDRAPTIPTRELSVGRIAGRIFSILQILLFYHYMKWYIGWAKTLENIQTEDLQCWKDTLRSYWVSRRWCGCKLNPTLLWIISLMNLLHDTFYQHSSY